LTIAAIASLFRDLEVVPRDLDRHAGLDVALRALELHQLGELLLGVEVEHVVRGTFVQERRKAIDPLPVVLGVFDGVEKGLFARGRSVLIRHVAVASAGSKSSGTG
jgi:hypothetical protein